MDRKCPQPNYEFTWIDGSQYKVMNISYEFESNIPFVNFVKLGDTEYSNKIHCIKLFDWFNIIDNIDRFNDVKVCIYE